MILDFASNGDFLRALLPEVVLSVAAMALLLWGVWMESEGEEGEGSDATSVLAGVAVAGIVLSALANGWLYGVEVLGDPQMVVVDRFRLFANWIFLGAAAVSVLLSVPYVRRQRLQAGEFYTLILLATVGMMLMVGTKNLILLFLALETMSIAAYVLTAYHRRDRRSAEAGLKYFILGAFSSAFLLYGIALVWGATGSVNLGEIARVIEGGAGFTGLLLTGMGLLGVGFAFKVAAVPFHMWTPDVYEGAPSPSTAFMATAVKAASFLAFTRVFLEAFPNLYETWFPILWWLAALTMVVGNVVALAQTNVKRMLAYSSVAHGGYLLVGLAAANAEATGALLFYLLIYAVMNLGAFGIVMIVGRQGEDRLQLEDYGGFGWDRPLLGVLLTIFLLSLAGFPGTAGFMAKIFLLQGAVASDLWTLAILLALTTVVSYYYYLRVAWMMWMRPAEHAREVEVVVPRGVQGVLLALAALLLLYGIFPSGLLSFAQEAARGLSGLPEIVSFLSR